MLGTGLVFMGAAEVAKSESAVTQSISDVQVDREGGDTVVTLMGLDQPVFTAFAQPDPDRVIVEITSVSASNVDSPIAVGDGLVREVGLSAVDSGNEEMLTRVELTLETPADYQVVSTADGLTVRLTAKAGAEAANQAASQADSADDPWALAATPSAATPMEMPEPMVAAMPAVEDASGSVATRLLAVESENTADGTLIRLRADGQVADAVTFTLDDPSRLVVDLPSLVSEARNSIAVGSPRVERVRVGQHDDKVRIVMDGGGADQPFDGRQIVPSPGGLMIALGAGPATDEALASALTLAPMSSGVAARVEPAAIATATVPASIDDSDPGEPDLESMALDSLPAMAAAEAGDSAEAPAGVTEGGIAGIYGIEFDNQDNRDRIVVLGDQPVDYFVFEPEPDTVIITLDGARIDPEAAVRITPEPGGPVSLVTAFEQPELATPEVRIVVQRAANLKPEVSRRGALLVIDFPHTGAVASAPPVMSTVASAAQTASPAASAPASMVAPAMATGLPAGVVPAVASVNPYPDVVPASVESGASIDLLQEGGLIDGKQYTGRRVSLDFKDVDISDVLRLIAEVSELNVIAGDEVNGKVTIRLVDVPWDQALDVVLLTKGLGFMRIGNVLRIAPTSTIQQEEEMRLQERRAKEKLEDLIVKLQPVNYADVKEIKRMTERLLSPRGTVNTDARTNTIILKDIPSVVDEATALIKAIDTQTPQVMIEAKIVEASLDFSREFGVQWAIGAQTLNDAFDGGSGIRQDLAGGRDLVFSSPNNAVFSNPITANPTGLFNMAAFLLDQKLNLDLQLQAAEVNGDGKVISSPRVVTLDNSKASIEQGVSIPFQTFENGDAQLEFVDAVLKLEVTPHITADKSIIMKISVNRNAPDDSVFTLTGSPAIAKNQVKTETLVKDGQTLVLGGIYVVDKSDRQSRVPYLHSIPIIGAAFRSDEHSESRKELLIFVTPRVVVAPEDA